MSQGQKFSAGFDLISSLYNNKLNGQPFNRNSLKSTVTSLLKIGFKHVGNDGTIAILEHSKYDTVHTIRIGKHEELSFFEHFTTEQQTFTF